MAQTAGTVTIAATNNNGDRDATAPGLQVNEGDRVTVALTANGLTGGVIVLALNYAGTASNSSDFGIGDSSVAPSTGNIRFPSTSGEGAFNIRDDTAPEGDETIIITASIIEDLSSPVPTFTSTDSLTITILANDGYMALAITVDDANTEEGDTAEFTVTLSGVAPTSPVTVDWAVSGDVDSSDHDASGGTLTFTAAGSQTIRIAIASDFDAESTEDLTVTLSNQSSGVTFANAADNAATTTIAASPLARRLTLTGPATATEGADATYTVSLQGTAFASPTAVTWTIAHTDTAASDFAAVTGSIMFPTMTTFAIGVLDDDATAATEPAERFSVQISTADADANAIGEAVTTTIGGDADTTPPQFAAQDRQPGWSGGQSVLWLQVNEEFKVLPHPDGADGAAVPANTPSGTTLDRRDFTIVENSGSASSATIAVNSVAAAPQHRALRLTLARAIAANAQNLQVAYERVGNQAIYDTAVEMGLARNNRRNVMGAQTLVLTPNATADADSDGIPDAVEARIATDAGNPFVEVAETQQPAFAISRTAAQEPIAYSGIRAQGVRAHLGVASVATTEQAAAQTVTAYYRSDTFGYLDGMSYECDTGQFPANYDAPLADGGCAPVDWGNILPGVDHTIAWLAMSEEGVWAVNATADANDSNLPEQTIRRIPELNMASQRLFTTGAAVTVRADADDGRSFTESVTAGGVRTVDQVVGSSVTLWRPSETPPTASQYSVGLTTQTEVVVVAAGSVIPPVPGRPLLMRGSDVVNALAEGSAHELHIPLDNGGVITTETHAIAAAELAGLAGTVTDVAVRLPGGGGSVAAVFRYPVVSAMTNPLASAGDEDGDGIADMFDDFDGLSQLPVSATEAVRHIRPVFRSHRLRAGDETLARVVSASAVDYNAWQASEFAAGSVVYDFTIYEVDYAAVSSATPTGGVAGVIIPLPRAFRGAGVEVFKVGRGAFDRSGGDRYGFAMRRAEDGGCPDDADGLYSLSSGDCLAVYVTDGGPNDDDGEVNGVIKDPLGVRVGSGGGGSSSGAFGPAALIVLTMLAALLLLSVLRRRRMF